MMLLFFPKTRWRSQSQYEETAGTEVGKQVGKLSAELKILECNFPSIWLWRCLLKNFLPKARTHQEGQDSNTSRVKHICRSAVATSSSLKSLLCNYFWTRILGANIEQRNGEWGHFLSLLAPTFLCAGVGPCSCAVIIQAGIALWNKAGIAHPLFILLLSRGIGETPETEGVVSTALQKLLGSRQNIYGAAECQYLIHIPTSALRKHRSYQTILNQRNTYDHRFILKPQAHKTFIINSVFFGSSLWAQLLLLHGANKPKMSQPRQGKTGNSRVWRVPGLRERGAETSLVPIF